MHALHFAQVPRDLKTVIADFSSFEIIKMQGATEERAPMKAGPFGKIVADFPDGTETVDYANLLLETKPVEKKKSMKKKKKKSMKSMKKIKKKLAACKKPAAAVAASSTEDEEEEEGEEEEMDEDEEEEVEAAEAFEAPTALALPAAVPALPLPAAPEDCCMQCN